MLFTVGLESDPAVSFLQPLGKLLQSSANELMMFGHAKTPDLKNLIEQGGADKVGMGLNAQPAMLKVQS